MKVQLIFNAQFCGYFEEIIEIPDDSTDEEIKEMFPLYMMDIKFNNNCSYKILDNEYNPKNN